MKKHDTLSSPVHFLIKKKKKVINIIDCVENKGKLLWKANKSLGSGDYWQYVRKRCETVACGQSMQVRPTGWASSSPPLGVTSSCVLFFFFFTSLVRYETIQRGLRDSNFFFFCFCVGDALFFYSFYRSDMHVLEWMYPKSAKSLDGCCSFFSSNSRYYFFASFQWFLLSLDKIIQNLIFTLIIEFFFFLT